MARIARTAVVAAALVVAAGPALVGAAPAAAEATALPFTQTLRRCDFSAFDYVGGSYYGRAVAKLRTDGADVVADVQFATGVPNTAYDVRLIQLPRSSMGGCSAADPGVAAGTLFTDGNGGGAVTVRGPLMSGATGAWVSITRPSAFSQQPEEFYTSGFVAEL